MAPLAGETVSLPRFSALHKRGNEHRLSTSSFVRWDEVAAWYSALQKSQMQVTPEIRAKAEDLTRDKETDNEKIHAIYDYVSTRFRYISISLGQGRYVPHLASDVLANGYGDCKDKHTPMRSRLSEIY
jgi:transglutaminase-like putative cysteine protease